MLTPQEKQDTGATYEIVYRIPVGDVPYAITVALLVNENLTPVSRGVSIVSPSEEVREFRTMMKNGYHRAHGRAVTAIKEWNDGLTIREHAEILPDRFAMDENHPIFVARNLFRYKLEAHPGIVTQREGYELEDLRKRLANHL